MEIITEDEMAGREGEIDRGEPGRVLTFVFVCFSFDAKNGHNHDDDHNWSRSQKDHKPDSSIEGNLETLRPEVKVDFAGRLDLENK